MHGCLGGGMCCAILGFLVGPNCGSLEDPTLLGVWVVHILPKFLVVFLCVPWENNPSCIVILYMVCPDFRAVNAYWGLLVSLVFLESLGCMCFHFVIFVFMVWSIPVCGSFLINSSLCGSGHSLCSMSNFCPFFFFLFPFFRGFHWLFINEDICHSLHLSATYTPVLQHFFSFFSVVSLYHIFWPFLGDGVCKGE